MNNYNSPSQLKVSDAEINQFIDEVVTMVADCCDVINENGKKTLKIKDNFKENGIYQSSKFAYKKKDPKERHYRDMMMCDNQEIVFDVLPSTKNVIGITTPINKKHGNGYCVFHLHCGKNLFMPNENAPEYRFSIRDYDGIDLTETIGLKDFINKILKKKEEKKKEKNKNNNVMQEEEKEENSNLKSNDDFLKYINGSDDNKGKEKKGPTACQKKQKKKTKQREKNIKKLEEEEKRKQIAEKQKKLAEEEKKKQKQELDRQRQFRNKWLKMKEGVIDHAECKETRKIVNNLKNYKAKNKAKKEEAKENIKKLAIKKIKKDMVRNLVNYKKHYIPKPGYNTITNNQIGLSAAMNYYGDDDIKAVVSSYYDNQQGNNIDNQIQCTPLNLNSKPFKLGKSEH